MKIYDIPQATKITINLVHKKSSYRVEATVLTRYGDGILVTPIFCGGGPIDFCNSANFEYVENVSGVKHMFQVDSISRVDFSGSDFHVVTGKEIVIADNQRKAERYKVQLMANAVINRTEALSVVINDISMRGFSLIVGKSSDFKVGDKVRVDFMKNAADRKSIIRGVIVRKFLLNGYEAVGCEIEDISPRVLGFIMEKKAEHMQRISASVSA